MKLRDFGLPILLAITFSLSDPCVPSSSKEPDQPGPEDFVYEVKTISPRFEESPRYAAATGIFSASDRLNVKAEFDGNIEKIYVGEGDTVNVDDPLCLFKSERLNQEIEKKQVELKEAEARLELDRRNFEAHGGQPPGGHLPGSQPLGGEPLSPPSPEPSETEPAFLDEEMPE